MRDLFFQRFNKRRIWWIASLGIFIGMMFSAFRFPGGDDLYRYYIPFEQGCMDCGFIPYYAKWFLSPLLILPKYPYAWPVWTIVNLLGFLALAFFTDINPFFFLISFPVVGQIWLGQVDLVICIGIAIILFAKNPYFRGVGISLALIKPQLMVLPILFYILLENRRHILKLAVVPVLVFLTSLLVFGISWPLHWFSNALQNLPIHTWRLASMEIWRFGIFLMPLPLLIQDPKTRLYASLLVSSLATPFFGVYSYTLFLLLDVNLWISALSYIWVMGYLWLGASAMRLAWVLPLGILLNVMFNVWRAKRESVFMNQSET